MRVPNTPVRAPKLVEHFPISSESGRVPRPQHSSDHIFLTPTRLDQRCKVTAFESPPDCRFGAYQQRRRGRGFTPATPSCTSALDNDDDDETLHHPTADPCL